jgi:serine/threonine protein kinase
MELCRATLEQLIKGEYDGPVIGTDKEILLQVAKAVEYLADKGLVYRNINPRSILVSPPDGNIPPKIKLVDFSISREMAPGRTELSFSGVVRNGHWAAPEIHEGKPYTSAVDVFSAGCVFAYFLSSGVHPFGPLLRNYNITNGVMTMPEEIKDGAAIDLIKQMLKHDPKDRIDVHEVPMHPYFWSETKCLEFVQATCRTVKPEVNSNGALFQALEADKEAVFQGEWTVNLTDEVRTNLFEGRQTRTNSSVYFLLKAIRNKVVACCSLSHSHHILILFLFSGNTSMN